VTDNFQDFSQYLVRGWWEVKEDCQFFKDSSSTARYSNAEDETVMNGEFKRIWKEAVGLYFKLLRGTEKNYKEKLSQDYLLAENKNQYKPNRK
jgi:hypothetical protein